MWQLVVWACSQFSASCASVPDVATIQAAYEQEASSAGTLHDTGLKVLKAKCHDNPGESILCEVTFLSRNDPTERLYFDIVAVARKGGGWELKSGLCKR